MQDSSDKLRFLLGHLHHMTLEGHPDTDMPQADESQDQDANSHTHEKVNVNFSMHWRYNQSDSQYTTNPDYEGIIAEANTVFQKCGMESDMLNNVCYQKHTDRAYLAFYKVPQFGICIGRLPDGSPCCAVIVRIVDGKCLTKDGPQDITVAELSSISASPQRNGYGTQLMRYITTILKEKVDVIELKVRVKHVLEDDWTALYAFYGKFGFDGQKCQCDACRLVPNDKGHLQMINKLNENLSGSMVLSTDVSYEIIQKRAYERGGGWRACDVYSRDQI
jgi:ribosomal protein S18 acetylase RimI-like enzyme